MGRLRRRRPVDRGASAECAYADVEGNTGLWITGKVPVRGQGTGMVPAPGWDDAWEWTGEVPFEAMPHVLNPERGFVVTCNDRLVPDDYPYFLGSVWMNGYRNRRITSVLAGTERLGVDDFRRLHIDFTCPPAQEFVELLRGFAAPGGCRQAGMPVAGGMGRRALCRERRRKLSTRSLATTWCATCSSRPSARR